VIQHRFVQIGDHVPGTRHPMPDQGARNDSGACGGFEHRHRGKRSDAGRDTCRISLDYQRNRVGVVELSNRACKDYLSIGHLAESPENSILAADPAMSKQIG
jgi:hypothetical protein